MGRALMSYYNVNVSSGSGGDCWKEKEDNQRDLNKLLPALIILSKAQLFGRLVPSSATA